MADDDTRLSLLGTLRSLGPNKIEGLTGACNKVSLSLSLNFTAEVVATGCEWWPITFILPRDIQEASEMMHRKQKSLPARTFIYKPDASFGGAGVCLAQTGESLQDLLQRKMSGCAVLQEYVPRPLLVDGYKWDSRVYVLVTSIEPLRVYVARDGLARFCTELYRRPNMSNLDASYSHLTNYTLNKTSPGFCTAAGDPSGGQGSKRALSAVLQRIEKLSCTFTVQGFWEQVDHIVTMTLISLQPELIQRQPDSRAKHEGSGTERSSFHLLGFDVLLDSNGRVSLLEVNANPSLSTEMGGYDASTGRLEVHTCAVDHAIKSAIVEGVQQVLDHEDQSSSPDDMGPVLSAFSKLKFQNPEYRRVSQLLRRIMRLQQRALQIPASVCGERAGELGPSRLLHFVRTSGLLSVRTEPCSRAGRSASGMRRALSPATVEHICRSVLSWSRGLQRSQPEHTRFGHMLIALARQQETIPRDGSASCTPTAELLEKFTRKLETQLSTSADMIACGTAGSSGQTEKPGTSTDIATLNRPRMRGPLKHSGQITLGSMRGPRPLVMPMRERGCCLGIKLRRTWTGEQGTGPPQNVCSSDDTPRRPRPISRTGRKVATQVPKPWWENTLEAKVTTSAWRDRLLSRGLS